MIHSASQIKRLEMKQIFLTSNYKLKCVYLRGGLPPPSTPRFNTLPTWIKYSKSFFNSKNYIIIFRKIGTELRVEKNNFDRIWTAQYIGYKFISNVLCTLKLLFKNCIKKQEMNLQQFPQIVTHTSELFCAALYTSYQCYSYHIL